MASLDDFARLCAEEIRTAANLDRAAKIRNQSAPHVADSSLVVALKSIGQLLGGMRETDQNRIIALTVQRLGVDPEKLKRALDAVATNNPLLAAQEIRDIIDEAT